MSPFLVPGRCLPTLVLLAGLAAAPCASARPGDASEASAAASVLPVAALSTGSAAVFTAGAELTVVAVEASAAGTTWVVEQAAGGARASLHLAGEASLGVGTAIVATAVGTGWVVSAAGRALAFVPNAFGATLLHSEPVAR